LPFGHGCLVSSWSSVDLSASASYFPVLHLLAFRSLGTCVILKIKHLLSIRYKNTCRSAAAAKKTTRPLDIVKLTF